MPKRPWEKHLTPQERAAIKRLDATIAELSDDMALAKSRRSKIQNRASRRAGYANGKKAKG